MDEQVTAKQRQKFTWGLSAWMVALFLLGLAFAWDLLIFPNGFHISLTRLVLHGASLVLMLVGLYFGFASGFKNQKLQDRMKAIRRRGLLSSTIGGVIAALAIFMLRAPLPDIRPLQILGAVFFGAGIWALVYLIFLLRAYSVADLPISETEERRSA